MTSVQNNAGFSRGTWKLNIIDLTSNVLIAQHTIELTGGGTPPVTYLNYPGFTVEAWIKWNIPPAPTSYDQQWAMIVVDGDSDNNRVYQIGHDMINDHFEFRIRAANNQEGLIMSNTKPKQGIWYHVAEVYNQTPGTFKIFVDGNSETGTGTWSPYTGGMHSTTGIYQVGGPAGISYNWASGQRKFNGDIRGLKTYGRAMGPDEVASRFATGLPPA